jgi:DNA-binding beta-propeller fold protein YncE
VIDGHSSFVYKIDNEIDEVVASTSTGVAGPYGIAINWDETRAFIVAKGEGAHNKGAVLGVVDLERFRAARDLRQMPIWLGGSASSVDHAILRPDPEVNELWVSNMNGWETIVLDIETYTATDWIATAVGGNTHSGAFVSCTSSREGTLEADMGGPKSPEMWTAVQAKVAAAAQ